MKFRVCSRPSSSTTVPASPIFLQASPANLTTSPWVSLATVGMFLPTLGSFSSVLAISEILALIPRPLILMSNTPSNSPNSSMPAHVARFSGVRTAGSKPSRPCCSQCVAARSVSERKQFPLDQAEALGILSLILSTVVPLPVPLRPTRIITQPPSFGSLAMISSATWSAVLPKTSICSYSGGVKSPGSTPFRMAWSTPAASFSASSSSRATMPSSSFFASSMKTGSSFRSAMTAPEVLSSWALRSARLSSAMAACEGEACRAQTALGWKTL
mmetsp:Transcript_74162/g.194504  ORF Transcript_74162/g.194504 Transcript_74162/m.194504 type:complete len:272 (+) Transcript_74162:332-1147(+)